MPSFDNDGRRAAAGGNRGFVPGQRVLCQRGVVCRSKVTRPNGSQPDISQQADPDPETLLGPAGGATVAPARHRSASLRCQARRESPSPRARRRSGPGGPASQRGEAPCRVGAPSAQDHPSCTERGLCTAAVGPISLHEARPSSRGRDYRRAARVGWVRRPPPSSPRGAPPTFPARGAARAARRAAARFLCGARGVRGRGGAGGGCWRGLAGIRAVKLAKRAGAMLPSGCSGVVGAAGRRLLPGAGLAYFSVRGPACIPVRGAARAARRGARRSAMIA